MIQCFDSGRRIRNSAPTIMQFRSEHNTDLDDDEMGDVVDGCGSDGEGGWEEAK